MNDALGLEFPLPCTRRFVMYLRGPSGILHVVVYSNCEKTFDLETPVQAISRFRWPSPCNLAKSRLVHPASSLKIALPGGG